MIYFDLIIWISIFIYVGGALVMLRALLTKVSVDRAARPFVSVVIAARNEAQRLPDLLADLAAQTYADFEVLIVDDRSTDRTAEVVREAEHAAPHRLTLLRQTEVPAGLSPKKMALQKGIAAGRGEVLLLTDADCRVRPTWVERMAAHYAPDVAMVLGYSELQINHTSGLFERVQAFEFLTLVAAMAGSAKAQRPFGASGQNISFRRSAFDAVGGYQQIMHRIAGDDMLMLQLIKAHPQIGRIVYADDAGAYNRTYPEQTWRAFRNQRARWASSGTHHFRSDLVFAVYAVNSLVLNMTVLFGVFWAWAKWISLSAWLCAVGFKLGADVLFYSLAAVRFRRAELLRYLPLWFLSQPLYILAMAFWGQRRRTWVWKP